MVFTYLGILARQELLGHTSVASFYPLTWLMLSPRPLTPHTREGRQGKTHVKIAHLNAKSIYLKALEVLPGLQLHGNQINICLNGIRKSGSNYSPINSD